MLDNTVHKTDSLDHAKKVYCNQDCPTFKNCGNTCRKEGRICTVVKIVAYDHFTNIPVIKR